MLKILNVQSVNLITNNPLKIKGLEDNGIKVEKRTSAEVPYNEKNFSYLKVKKERMNHMLNLIS